MSARATSGRAERDSREPYRRETTVLKVTKRLETACEHATAIVDQLAALHYRYRDGRVHVNVPEALFEIDGPLEELIREHLPASAAALDAASRNLFFSLP